MLVWGLGEGVCLAELAAAGLSVVAVDYDLAKVASARSLVPGAFVVTADVRDAVTGSSMDAVVVSSGVLGGHSESFVAFTLARAASFVRGGGLVGASSVVRVGGGLTAPGWEGIRTLEMSLMRAASASGLAVVGTRREPSAKSGDLCRVIVLAKKRVASEGGAKDGGENGVVGGVTNVGGGKAGGGLKLVEKDDVGGGGP